MTIEHPVLRLGLAGFDASQAEGIAQMLAGAASGTTAWELGNFASADAWWFDARRARILPGDTLQVEPGDGQALLLQLHLPDVDRPIAFSGPMVLPATPESFTFDPTSAASVAGVLEKFESWLSPLTAQFCLAAHIVDHQSALQGGVHEVVGADRLLAVVDMHGDAAVLPGSSPGDFENSEWRRREADRPLPENFARVSLSQLMWQYAVRTQRDLLPKHYRSGLLYFRRPPHLPNRLLQDSHLLLMRELALAPLNFSTLQHRTGLSPARLAHELAALYFVGTITSNPKRAPRPHRGPRLEENTGASQTSLLLPSSIDSALTEDGKPANLTDLTAPASLRPQ